MSRAPLAVLGFGMTTAVGLTGRATCAAFRARIDGVQETHFVATGGSRLKGAIVQLEEPWQGVPRLARLVSGPIAECLNLIPNHTSDDIPLLLGVAESDRPGRFPYLDSFILTEVQAALDVRFHPSSRTVPMGRVAGAAGMREASRLVNEAGFPRVIVAGVDSYLVSATLASFHERGRLLTEDNSNGFIPGEAGAALLCGPDGDDRSGVSILSLGFAVEQAVIGGDHPLRGDGLTHAFQHALLSAGLEMAQVGYRLSSMNGEQYWSKEIDLATIRLLRGRHDEIDLWHPASCIGEVGAASLPISLGLAAAAASGRWAPGDPALVAAANDDGRRAVLLASAVRRPR